MKTEAFIFLSSDGLHEIMAMSFVSERTEDHRVGNVQLIQLCFLLHLVRFAFIVHAFDGDRLELSIC